MEGEYKSAGLHPFLDLKKLNDTIFLCDWLELNSTECPLEDRKDWTAKASLIRFPTDPKTNIVLQCENMPGSIVVKQADVILINDLLHYHHNQSLITLNFYAAHHSETGPAMTWSSFSIVANEISPPGCSSYTYDLLSRRPYARAPWFQFSESMLDEWEYDPEIPNPGFPFLTGMGGANRIAIFGYLGCTARLSSYRSFHTPSDPAD